MLEVSNKVEEKDKLNISIVKELYLMEDGKMIVRLKVS